MNPEFQVCIRGDIRVNSIDIEKEFYLRRYDKIIEYADEIQQDLIHNLHVGNDRKLEHLSLMSNNILNIWIDTISRKKLWVALIRCGAWIGTLETVQRLFYEKNKKKWFDKLKNEGYIVE